MIGIPEQAIPPRPLATAAGVVAATLLGTGMTSALSLPEEVAMESEMFEAQARCHAYAEKAGMTAPARAHLLEAVARGRSLFDYVVAEQAQRLADGKPADDEMLWIADNGLGDVLVGEALAEQIEIAQSDLDATTPATDAAHKLYDDANCPGIMP